MVKLKLSAHLCIEVRTIIEKNSINQMFGLDVNCDL